jgi:Alginate export
MYRKTLCYRAAGLVISCFFMQYGLHAQFSLSGQLRTRTELRNGLGTLKLSANKAAFLTSQRTRLSFNYKWNKVVFQTSLQDVRVWGQDASTISNADGAKLGVHEAWADVILANKKDTIFKKHQPVEYCSIKIGRQELLYDDSRLLGNLDWLQQARRHDAVVLKMLNKGWQVDLGAAFNQNTDAFNYNGTFYTPANVMPYVKDSKGNLMATPTGFLPLTTAAGFSSKTGNPAVINSPGTNGLNQNYKALQFLYAGKKWGQTKITALVLSDHFGKYKTDSVKNISGTDTGYLFGRRFNQTGVNTRITIGLLLTSQLSKPLALTAGVYYQGGKDKDGLKLAAYTSTLALAFTANKFSYIAGWDYVSGNDAFSASTTNHRFDPLYGTPHKFWGYMDYFYVGTGSPTGGLSNAYFKVKYIAANKNLSVGLDYHYFSLAQHQKDISSNPVKKYLGSEFDLIANYNLNKITNLEFGFCYMAATKSMEYAKGIATGTSNLNPTWSYLQINIKPDFFSK